jgi:L-seryl-tRNA(Ser) seleniumtransferase
MIGLAEFCATCHAADVPVIVDAASMPDPRPYLAAGSDLVLFSAHKAFGALTAGVVAGRASLVDACLLQQHGIGRPMKVGKEGVIGAIAALEGWATDDHAERRAAIARRVQRVVARLGGLRGVRAAPQASQQVRLELDARQGLSAAEMSRRLRERDPAILVWDLHAEAGVLVLTLGKVDDAVAEVVCDAIAGLVGPGLVPAQ